MNTTHSLSVHIDTPSLYILIDTLSEDNTERKHVMLSLGATSDPKLQLRTLDWAVKGQDVKLQDFFYPIRSVAAVR